MDDLNVTVESVEPVPYAAAPMLAFKLRATTDESERAVHNVLLQCQLQIESTRRRYEPAEQERLLDLFGEPQRWRDTLRPMLWTHASVTIPPFTGTTTVNLTVPCTFDFNVAATKYFAGLEQGEVPLLFLFSGTIFHVADDGGLSVARIGWDKEARFRLPVRVWQALMEQYYPNTAWLHIRRDVFDGLYAYKRQNGIPTWEQTIERLLAAAKEVDRDDRSLCTESEP